MTLAAEVIVDIDATKTAKSGLSSSIDSNAMRISVNVGDCTKVWSDRRTIGATSYDDINLTTLAQINVVKLLCVQNLSRSSTIALSAGYNVATGDFRLFPTDATSWNFAPIVNLGSATLRGLPIRPRGSYLLSCPNSDGFSTLTGGSVLRIGGPSGAGYEIYVLGT